MKKAALLAIDFYRVFLSVALKSIVGSPSVCKFSETCSSYTRRMVEEKGAIKGIRLGFIRISKCQPFAYNV